MERSKEVAEEVLELEECLSEKTRITEELRRLRRTSRLVVDGTSQGFLLLDPHLAVTDLNKAVLEILDYAPEELRGKHFYDLYDQGPIEFYFADGNHLSFEATFLTKLGKRIPILFNRSTLREASGELTGYVAFLTDLTELKAAEAERRRAELLYEGMYRNAVQGMFQSTLSGRILRANPAFRRLLGYEDSEEVFLREGTAEKFHEDVDDHRTMTAHLKEEGALSNYELELRRRDGSPVWALANVRLATDEAGEPIIEGILVDNTARKIAEDKLRRSEESYRYLAEHDALTGLYNRRYLYDHVAALLGRRNTQLSLSFMDLDNFKLVVDAHGHLHGSRVIQEVAGTIRGALVEPAYGVSYAGDEFVLVLPAVDKEQALPMIAELQGRILHTPYLSSEGLKVHISASFGLATYPEDATDLTGLLAKADRALFDAKGRGRNAIAVIRRGASIIWRP
jgi:diguanylate cyclase (GGDEF)-like protein/PAS domain S-box-containing protein